MKDYNLPPTEEFAYLTGKERYPFQWLTMMKSVMNDYWFDCSNIKENIDEWDYETIDEFIHKLYYCWIRTCHEVNGNMHKRCPYQKGDCMYPNECEDCNSEESE